MSENKIIKGKTSTGFEYELSKDRLNNYEVIELLGEIEEDARALPKMLDLILGKEHKDKLKEHVRTDEGFVPVDKITEEISEIMSSHDELKNS